MINDQPETLDDSFNGRQFNDVERNDTSKSLLFDEQNKNGTCQHYSCLIYYIIIRYLILSLIITLST